MNTSTPTDLSFIITIFFSTNLLLITASLGAQELAILQSFKEQSKSIDGGTGLSDWDINSSTDYCNWGGVTCSSNGSITKLDFQSRGLRSPLPTIICTLPNLVELNLFNNSYNEEFPVGLFNCTKSLLNLNLSYNFFYGSLPNGPNTWSNLSSLTSLDLGSNSFTGQFPPTIGDDLLSLEYLNTWANNFNGFIPPNLGNLSHLKNLSMAWNNYTYAPLPQELSKLSELVWLYCGACHLIGPFPAWLSGLRNLEHIDLSYNDLSGALPAQVFKWPLVRRLELYFNKFSGTIPTTVGNLTTLTELDLSCNQLEGPIPTELGNLTNLTLLNLWNNSLSGEIPLELASIKSMQVFQLFQNQLVGTIPPTLGQGGSMVKFDVSSNLLHGLVPPYLCDSKALVKLIFFSNNISGVIPDVYGQCDTLVRVRLHTNQLSGSVPSGLWSLPRMVILELYNNNLSGSISPSLGDATQLTTLNIFNNAFTGSLPSSIGLLSLLLTLDASRNLLSESIPISLQNCHSLQTIKLQENDFSGDIPDIFATVTNMSVIDLSYNRLTGPIPSSLGDLHFLSSVNLTHNHLSGEVPSSLSNLKYMLRSFDVSYNDLSGSLPFELGGAFMEQSFEGNMDLCISNLKHCSGTKGGAQAGWIAGTIGVIVVVLVTGLCCFYKQKKEYQRMKEHSTTLLHATWIFTPFEKVSFDEYTILSFLDEDNLIGKGGSGQVYHGKLKNGQSLAIKRLWVNTSSTKLGGHSFLHNHDYGFKAEIETIGKVRHANLVKLLCCCTNNRDTSLLIYEYMPNGSLGDLLHGTKSGTLDWNTRFKIALGTSRGLAYLHHDCVPPIVHRDVKPNNILLDSDYEAKIGDFGLAKVLHDYWSHKGFTISGFAGSVGYMAPEMGYASKITEKCDVYSFGVVLLELLTGKKAISEEFGLGVDIVKWVTGKLRTKEEVMGSLLFYNTTKGDIEDSVPMQSKAEEHEMLVVLKLALRCTSAIASQRPNMKEVVNILEEAWRQGGHGDGLRHTSSSSSSSKHLLYSGTNKWKDPLAMEPPSPGTVFELDYCKAQLSGR